MTFADSAAGGAALADVLRRQWADRRDARAPAVVAIDAESRPIAAAILGSVGLHASDTRIIAAHPDVASGTVTFGDAEGAMVESAVVEGVVVDGPVLVVTIGVETGQAALLVGGDLRARGAAEVHLATPVCPRQAEPELLRVYDEIVAVERPLARRSLAWHYEDRRSIG